MMDQENPYQASAASAPLEPRFRSTTAPEGAFVRNVQFYLRLVGVYFLVDGIAGIAGSVVYWIAQLYVWRKAGYSPEVDPYTLMALSSSALLLVAGLYLVVGGQWVIEKIFLASPYSRFQGEKLSEEAEQPAG